MAAYRRIIARMAATLGIIYVLTLFALIKLENRLVYPGAYMPPTRPQPTATDAFSSTPIPVAKNQPNTTELDDQSSIQINQKPLVTSNREDSITDVSYRTCDGLLLWGRLLEMSTQRLPPASSHSSGGSPHDPLCETVLVLHGNGNRAVYLDERLHRISSWLNANVLAAEYRGFEDHHKPSEAGLQKDCLAAMDFLCSRYNISPKEVSIFGTSLGGGCATALAAERGAKVVILDRSFDRLVDVAAQRYPIFPVRSIMKNRFDSISNLQKYRGPLIMIHGDRDEVVDISRGRNLFEQAACSPKKWIEVPGLSHMMKLEDHTLRIMQQTFKDFTNPDSNLGSIKQVAETDRQNAAIGEENQTQFSTDLEKPSEAYSNPDSVSDDRN